MVALGCGRYIRNSPVLLAKENCEFLAMAEERSVSNNDESIER